MQGGERAVIVHAIQPGLDEGHLQALLGEETERTRMMLHKYNGPARDSCGIIDGVWSKCGVRVQPWRIVYKWMYVTCEACLAHPDFSIASTKKRKK